MVIECPYQRETALYENPPCLHPENTPVRRPVEILTAEEVKSLLRACSGRAPTGIRNRSLLALGWRGGLRLGEVLALYPKDLDREAGTVNDLGADIYPVQSWLGHTDPKTTERYAQMRPIPIARIFNPKAKGAS